MRPFGLLLLTCVLFCSPGFGRAASPPNILVLLADDVDWGDFGCYGNKGIETPHIDALAASGVRFENAFLTSPQCSPTRISVLTGKYPHSTGAEDLHTPLPEGQCLVPTYLKKAGYLTGHMLKTHYGPLGIGQFDWYSDQVEDFSKFLDEKGDRPFFLWVGFRDAHRPYRKGAFDPPQDPSQVQVPPYLVDDATTRADLADYYDEIRRMDRDIGRMIEELRRRGDLENTLIVYFNDNGRPFPRAKGTLYDSGMKTALLFSWPGRIDPGSVCQGLTSVVDLAPTFLDAAGLKIPPDMQGTSLRPVLENPRLPGRDFIFAERNWHNCDEHMRCVRTLDFKLIHNSYTDLPHGTPSDLAGSPSWKVLREGEEKGTLTRAQSMLFDYPRPEWELYDVRRDPWETENLAYHRDYRETFSALAKTLSEWSTATGDFPPSSRRRADNVDRLTGEKFSKEVPPQVP